MTTTTYAYRSASEPGYGHLHMDLKIADITGHIKVEAGSVVNLSGEVTLEASQFCFYTLEVLRADPTMVMSGEALYKLLVPFIKHHVVELVRPDLMDGVPPMLKIKPTGGRDPIVYAVKEVEPLRSMYFCEWV